MADEDAPSQTSDQYSQPSSSTTTTTPESQQTQQTQTQRSESMNEPPNVQPVDLFFQTASADLTESAKSDLWKLAQWARCNPHAAVILEGHADPRGTQNFNLKLSAERAAKVRAKLLSMGVPSDRIVMTIYGENGPPRGSYQQDRRVTARAVTRPIPTADFAG